MLNLLFKFLFTALVLLPFVLLTIATLTFFVGPGVVLPWYVLIWSGLVSVLLFDYFKRNFWNRS